MMFKQALRRLLSPLMVISILAPAVGAAAPAKGQGVSQPRSINFKVTGPNQRLEMTVKTSRRLTLNEKIIEAQVNNPDIVEIAPLRPNEIQISAKAPGVTQVNLFAEQKPGEDQRIYTIDIVVYADARELAELLRSQFPNASLKVVPVASGVLISGYVDRPEDSSDIIRIAEQFYPNVISRITVSGVQQVLVHVKVMEVSRTKLRTLGFNFSKLAAAGSFVSTAAGIVANAETISFNVIDGGSAFYGVLEALRQDKLMKVLSEPNLVAISGRPSYFEVGGELGYVKSTSIDGTVTVAFKEYGTRVDFVAMVLGNGRIRLEVRPRVSEIDRANSMMGIPALRTRTVDTGVELQAGQTLAIAGLVQNRVEAENRGLPWVSEVPFLGALFRRVEEQNNEVELLIMVTPELIDPMDAQEVPRCGPGQRTTSPSDWELFVPGHLEVPNCCPSCNGSGCPACNTPGGGANPTNIPRDGMNIPRDGMIIEEQKEVHQPQPPDSARRPSRPAPSLPAPSLSAPSLPALSSPLRRPTPDRPAVSQSRYIRSKPQVSQGVSRSGKQSAESGFIGPVGYDVVN